MKVFIPAYCPVILNRIIQRRSLIYPLEPPSKDDQHRTQSNTSPELGELGLVYVDQGLIHIIGGIKFQGLLGGRRSLGLGIVTGKNAAVFGFDGLETVPVVHLGSGAL